ncbi:MAG: YCF48-related protein [Bacteroidetes bacterium]|nr:YCF48-related protein [Bacteroidota bacterium]
MKKKIINTFLISVILNIAVVYSQNTSNDWILLNPLPSASTARAVYFLNDQVGFILNDRQILSTADRGENWIVQQEITSGIDMAFKDNYGYIIGNRVVYKSTYMGAEWHLLNTNFTENLTGLSVISRDTVFITGRNRLFVTFDGGSTWNTFNVPMGDWGSAAITSSFFTSSSIGFVGCSNGDVLKTTDGGVTWELKWSINLSPADIRTIYFYNSNIGFISLGHGRLLRTTDGGETWNQLSGISERFNRFHFISEQIGFAVGSHGRIFKTTNGGDNWALSGFQSGVHGGVSGTDLFGVHFINNSIGFAVGMQGRIVKTTDGGNSWQEYATTHGEVRQLQFVSNLVAYALVGNSFFKTTNGGKDWVNMGAPVPTGNTTRFHFVDENIGFCIAGGISGTTASVARVYKTINGGITWSATNNGHNLMIDDLFSIHFIDKNIGFAGGGNNHTATFKTTDGGNSWTQVNSYRFGQIQFINSDVGFASSKWRHPSRIFKTTDGGKTWTVVFEVNGRIEAMQFLNENVGFFVGNESLMYKTVDGGTTWQRLTVPFGSYVSVKFLNQDIGFITDFHGDTYHTENGGISWQPLQKPYRVTGLEIYGNTLYAFGRNGVILKRNIDYHTSLTENELLHFVIYPNPATDNIFIESDWTIEKIKIYDLAGRNVLNVVYKKGQAINISSFPSGIYFVRIFSENRVITRKIIKK